MKRFFRKILPLRNRYLIAMDLLGVLAMPSIAFLLRTESQHAYASFFTAIVILTIGAAVLKMGVYYRMGMYAQYWPFAGLSEVAGMVRATVLAALLEMVLYVLVLIPSGVMPQDFPNSVPFLDALFSMVYVVGSRVALTLMFSMGNDKKCPVDQKPVLIVGAGEGGLMIGRQLLLNRQLGLNPIGYLDDDPRKIGKNINGIRVVGPVPKLREILAKTTVKEVIIAIPTSSGKLVREIVQACKEAGVPSRTVPSLLDIVRGSARVEQIRAVQLEDLLKRGAVRAESKSVHDILNCSRILVTGAGGSIGSEICRQVMDFDPLELVLLGHGENSIYNILAELRKLPGKNAKIIPVIGDIRDRRRMQQVFERFRPDIVFHAAAHKHLPLMEDNVEDAITNNVIGTGILVDLAAAYDTERLVMISTDKAVNPTSILGVTKRIAELIVRDAGQQRHKRFVTVRFGNVLGSRGSVVPLFEQQIRSGGPITVAHPDVRRFFMTIPEAVQLVLQSASMGYNGEVFVLDMGEQIKIVDIARDLLRLNGLKEGKDIEIVFTGLKPGEKLYEELFFKDERVEDTEHQNILVCRNGVPKRALENGGICVPSLVLEALVTAARNGNTAEIYRLLKQMVPEYQAPSGMAEDLSQRKRPERLPAGLRGGVHSREDKGFRAR